MMELVNVVVTLEQPLDAGLRQRLAKAGLQEDMVLDAINVVTGRCEPDAIKAVEAIPGVAGVEIEGEVDIGPPDAPIS